MMIAGTNEQENGRLSNGPETRTNEFENRAGAETLHGREIRRKMRGQYMD
jgi:hypothetical protein